MPGKRSKIVCSRCKEIGGFLQKRWIKRTINIPKKETITNISDAWNYAAKVCLRMRELLVLLPPPSSDDKDMARHLYDEFNFGQHTPEEIKTFELKHLSTPTKNIKRKKIELTSNVRRTTERRDDEIGDYNSNKDIPWKTIHIKLPFDSGRITKSSVSMLYCAIVCLILRDACLLPLPTILNREFSKAIYTYFSLIEDDLRRRRIWPRWFPILSDVESHGYHGAAALNATSTSYCKNCSDSQKNIFVTMESLQQYNSIKNFCPKCGSEEPIKRRFSTKHLHNIYEKGLQKAQDVCIYLPLYRGKIMDMCKYIINNNKEEFLKRFQEYELLALRDLLSARKHYFVGHYDSAKKTRRRWCSITDRQLAQVKINDSRYFSQYLPLINEFVNVCIKGREDEDEHHILFEDVCNMLKELGWPEQYLRDKIYADVKNVLDQ